MKIIIFSLFLLALNLNSYPQPKPKEKQPVGTTERTQQKSYDSLLDVLSTHQNKFDLAIDTIKANTEIIKTNTEPPSVIVEFVQNKILDKLYDALFGDSESRGLIPIIISLTGFLVGLLRVGWLIIKFKKTKDSNFQKLQNIFICILLLIISILMFVLSNKQYTSPETVELSKLYDKINSIQKDIKASQVAVIRDTVSFPETVQLGKLYEKINSIQKDIKANQVVVVRDTVSSPIRVELSKLYDKINSVQKDIKANQVVGIRDTISNIKMTEVSAKVSNISQELNQIEQAIYKSEQKTQENIKDKSANGFWIFLNTILLVVIIAIFFIKRNHNNW